MTGATAPTGGAISNAPSGSPGRQEAGEPPAPGMHVEPRCRWMDNTFIARLWRSLTSGGIDLHAFATGSERRAGVRRWSTARTPTGRTRPRAADRRTGPCGPDRRSIGGMERAWTTSGNAANLSATWGPPLPSRRAGADHLGLSNRETPTAKPRIWSPARPEVAASRVGRHPRSDVEAQARRPRPADALGSATDQVNRAGGRSDTGTGDVQLGMGTGSLVSPGGFEPPTN